MGLDEQEKPIRQQPKSDETTSKAHLKPVWMGILPAVTMSRLVGRAGRAASWRAPVLGPPHTQKSDPTVPTVGVPHRSGQRKADRPEVMRTTHNQRQQCHQSKAEM